MWKKPLSNHPLAIKSRLLRERRKAEIFGDKKCRLCEIFLKSYYGAKGTREYCRRCNETGRAKLHTQKLAAQRYREKNKELIAQKDRERYLKRR